VSLATVGEAIQNLVGDFFNPLYLRDARYNALDSDIILARRPKTTRGGRRLKRGVSCSSHETRTKVWMLYDYYYYAKQTQFTME